MMIDLAREQVGSGKQQQQHRKIQALIPHERHWH